MTIVVCGINHRTAPLKVRERLAYDGEDALRVLERVVQPPIDGAVLLSTCNRTEFYLSTSVVESGAVIWRELSERLGSDARAYGYTHVDRVAIGHLFRVASGLDSILLGESQIQGQVRTAWEAARHTADVALARMFQTALMVGSRVRGETGIGEGVASAASAALAPARKVFGRLAGHRALILGAGAMGKFGGQILRHEALSQVTVASRHYDRAVTLARQLEAQPIRLSEAWPLLAEVDLVVCAMTTSGPLVTWDRVEAPLASRAGRPLCFLDVAVPRNVDPAIGQHENVFLYDVDDLLHVMNAAVDRRRDEIPAAEGIVQDEVEFFCEWLGGRRAVPTIRRFREHMERLREREVRRALRRLAHLPPEDREAVERLSRSLVSKLVHEPTVRLREAANNGNGSQMTEALDYLFGLDEGEESR